MSFKQSNLILAQQILLPRCRGVDTQRSHTDSSVRGWMDTIIIKAQIFTNVGNCTKHRINTTKTYIYMQPTQKPHWLMFRNVLQSNTKHPKTSHFKKLAPLSQKNTHIYGKSNRNTKKHGVKPRCSNFDKGLWWDSAHFPEIFHPFLRSMWKWKVQDLPKKSMHTPGSLKTKD